MPPTVLLVGIPVALSFWFLGAQRHPVHNSNDGAFHVAIIEQAQRLWSNGDLPFDGWFPGLTTGFPVLHHYQTLGHVLSGLLGVAIGPAAAYSWTLYVLLASWPISVHIGGRLLGWDRWHSGIAAFLSPLIVGLPFAWVGGRPAGTYGYEWRSYIWGGGAGVWAQLWGMWLLPLALGLTWRSVARRGNYTLASAVSASTLASHFITGYLALASVGVWILVKPSEFLRRLRRGAIVVVGSLLIAAWIVVPILLDNKWSSKTDYLEGWWRNSYGAGRVLWWFVTGQLFDYRRFPVITLLVAIGIFVCFKRWRQEERGRALALFFVASFLLLMGRTVVGPLVELLPGGDEILLPRMLIGVHLCGLYLASIAVVELGRFFHLRGERPVRLDLLANRRPLVLPVRVLGLFLLAVFVVPFVAHVWVGRSKFASHESLLVRGQEVADESDGAALADFVEFAHERGAGRFFGGTCTRTEPITHCYDGKREPESEPSRVWGATYRVFSVPVYTFLLNVGAEVIGYPFRTGSLLTDVEARFDERNPSHFDLFNIRYLILPDHRAPLAPATFLRSEGPHRLWEVEGSGYLKVIDTQGSIKATREDFGEAMEPFLRSGKLAKGIHPTVALEDEPAHETTLASGREMESPAGTIRRDQSRPKQGAFQGTITAQRRAAVMLKASFHGRWKATVDGREQRPYLVAPGYPAVTVSPGRHIVAFRYAPYPNYPWLLAIGLVTLISLPLISSAERWRRARRRRARQG